MIRRSTYRHRASHRSGSAYVAVMIVAVVVSLMAFSASRLARLHTREVRNESERHAARLLATSAIEHALVKFDNEPGWEMTYAFGTEYPATPVTANGGTFTWKLFDLGGGRKRLDGIGRVNEAECMLSVNLGVSNASSGLQVPMLCGGNLWIGEWTTTELLTVSGGPACSNSDLKNWSQINGSVEAQSESVSGAVTGTKTIPGTLRTLPDPVAVFDYYLAEGTNITAALAPGGFNLALGLLSPASNTLGGGVDPDGIYVINQPGATVSIDRCRIVGTLIAWVPGGTVKIKKQNNWEPARPNWPALMVKGNLEIILEDPDLSEFDIGVNLNPPGTPWQGSTDSDISDSYPSALAGIIYVTGNVIFDGKSSNQSAEIDGSLICGSWCKLTKWATPVIKYNNAPALAPPPGFGSGDASSIVGGSWRQTASP